MGLAGLYSGARYPDQPAMTGAAGFVARGNVVEKDTTLIAKPTKSVPGAVQLSRRSSNVDRAVEDFGAWVTHLDG